MDDDKKEIPENDDDKKKDEDNTPDDKINDEDSLSDKENESMPLFKVPDIGPIIPYSTIKSILNMSNAYKSMFQSTAYLSMIKSMLPIQQVYKVISDSILPVQMMQNNIAELALANSRILQQAIESILQPLKTINLAIPTMSSEFYRQTNMNFRDYINDVVGENVYKDINDIQKEEFVNDVVEISDEPYDKANWQQKLSELINKWKTKNPIFLKILIFILWVLQLLISTYIAVKVQNANIRKEPSTSSSIVKIVSVGDVIKTTDENKYWYKVEFEDDKSQKTCGWISKRTVKKIDKDIKDISGGN